MEASIVGLESSSCSCIQENGSREPTVLQQGPNAAKGAVLSTQLELGAARKTRTRKH